MLALIIGAIGFWAYRSGSLGRESMVFFGVLIPSVILHEISHGVAALAFGDDTAKRAGRLTLNPIAHVDPFGTLVLPGLLVLSGGAAFGYAKPVPVRIDRLRNPRWHSLWVSLVGPSTNILLAVVAALVFKAWQPTGWWLDIVLTFGLANVVLAVFNLIPLPPLDGSALLERLLPATWLTTYYRLRPYSMLILMGIFLMRPGTFDSIISPAVELWADLLL